MITTSLQIETSVASTPGTHAMTTTSPAFETTLISYANKILKSKSPSTANIDTSLAPYVTSILRAALSNLSDIDLADFMSTSSSSSLSSKIQTLAEYEALMELLMEQCEMESENAHSALTSIARAIQTGQFQNFGNRNRSLSLSMNTNRNSFSSTLVGNGVMAYRGFSSGNTNSMGKFRSKSMGAENDYYCQDDEIHLLGEMLKGNVGSASDGISSDSQIGAGMGKRRHKDSVDSTMSNSTLPDWSVAKRQDSPDRNVIEEEPSFFLEDDEASQEETPVKTPLNSILPDAYAESGCNMTPTETYLMSGLSPFFTDEEKKVAESLKNLPAPTFSFTPLKQDQLIPIDLLGVIDNPSTPANDLSKQYLIGGGSDAAGAADDETKDNDAAPSAHDDGQHTPHAVKVENEHTPLKKSDGNSAFVTSITLETIVSPLLVRAESKTLESPVSASGLTPQAKLHSSGKGKKKGYKKDNNLAVTLFSRPRSRSVSYDERSPKLKPMAPPPASKIGMAGLKNCSADALMTNSIPALFQKQLDSAVEILLAMNYDVCRDASHEAALVSNADVNVAQHVIDGVLSAPPVCRHMLTDGCYRSDCHFSHDVDGHTCLFWLRGRCGKGNSCRFMHGFSEKLLDGVNIDFRNSPQDREEEPSMFVLPPAQSTSTKPIAIKTGNLVHHNIKASFSLSNSLETRGFSSSPRVSFAESAGRLSRTGSLSDGGTLDSSVEQTTSPLSNSPLGPTPKEMKTSPPSTFSFASIASKGYSKQSSFNKCKTTPEQSGIGKALVENKKIVRIPQNLWTASQNRASGAFHISDPIERYKEVSTSVQRADVVDLHFQSVKTFPAVLSSVLPGKLKEHREVWIVTGSGHHVSRSSHQKGGGVLENAVIGWLASNEYNYSRGKDKNGFGGAILAHGR